MNLDRLVRLEVRREQEAKAFRFRRIRSVFNEGLPIEAVVERFNLHGEREVYRALEWLKKYEQKG